MCRAVMAGAVALVLAAPAAVVAQVCEPEEARARWELAEQARIIRGVEMVRRVPTVYVDGTVWRDLDLNARRGIALTLECVVAGPGNVLREIAIMDAGGLPLGRWDGIRRELQVLR